MSHTKEPWPVFTDIATTMTPDPEGTPVAILSWDDYIRARDCVNACAGYTTEELENATLDKRHRHEIIADLVKSNKQSDELLAALEEITNVFATIGMTAGCYDDELNALQKGLSAIASVKANTQ